MPFNGSGVYAPSGADFPVVSGTLISSSKYNNVINDIASALSLVLVADGQRAASADLPMGGFKHTNVADATARTNYPSLGQIQDQAGVWGGTAGGTANALSISPTPAILAYATGQRFVFKSGAATNSTAVTIAVSGLTTKAIQLGGVALSAGEIVANQWYSILYDGTAFQLTLLSTAYTYAVTPGTIAVNTTLVAADVNKLWVVTATALVTLPAASAVAMSAKIILKSTTTGLVLIDPAGVDTLDGLTTNYQLPSFCSMEITKSAAGTWIITQRPDMNVGDWLWAGYSTANQGWVKAGQNISRTTYSGLFAIYATAYGVGDGALTFGLPLHQSRTAVGAGTGTSVEVCTASSGNGLTVVSNLDRYNTGDVVVTSALSGFGGTIAATSYFAVRISATNVRFASTLALAQNLTPDITITGAGSVTLTQTFRARALGEQGGEDTHAMSITELIAHIHPGNAVGAGLNYAGGTNAGAVAIGSAGGNAAMNIIQPYMVGELYIKT